MKSIVAISGASGSAYAVRLLEALQGEKHLVVSETAKAILREETGKTAEDLRPLAYRCYEDDDMFSPIASGSVGFDVMFIAPCSESTVAKIASGIADTLITRAASVCIKEGRRLILLVRESPKSAIMLENELKLARLGVVIMDANPGFYPRPQTVEDIVDIVVGRCLDQARVDHDLYRRWSRRPSETVHATAPEARIQLFLRFLLYSYNRFMYHGKVYSQKNEERRIHVQPPRDQRAGHLHLADLCVQS
ncbi:MAG: UbiX family flavin prenyltransferase [Candidatus Methanomethylophilaceae archaeon]|nr:UbiX family flavin prenyltransferase [Candidatus Methanomethylophilaceae archaeon]